MDELTYELLAKLPLVRCYEKAFRKATGLDLRLVPVGPSQAPSASGTGSPAPCCAGSGPSEGIGSGIVTDQGPGLAGETTLAGPDTRECADCKVIAVPVQVGNSHVATWICRGRVGPQRMGNASRKAACQPALRGIKVRATRTRATSVTPQSVSDAQFQASGELVRLFALHVAQFLRREEDQLWVVRRRGEPRWISRAKAFLRVHIAEPVTARRLAAIVHVPPAYFIRVFRDVEGVAFSRYVLDLKVERAKRLLADPSIRIHEVARAIGLGSISQFTAVCLKRLGESPAGYRARLRARS